MMPEVIMPMSPSKTAISLAKGCLNDNIAISDGQTSDKSKVKRLSKRQIFNL